MKHENGRYSGTSVPGKSLPADFSKAGLELGLRFNRWFQRANALDYATVTFAACRSLSAFDHMGLPPATPSNREPEATGAENRAGVDEHILAPLSGDEAKAFSIVEPFDGSGLTAICGILLKGMVTVNRKTFPRNLFFLVRNGGNRFVLRG